MTLPLFLFVLASLLLHALSVPFVSKVRARRPDLLPALGLDAQPSWVQYARWRNSLLPYSAFMLRRAFVREFQNDRELLLLSELIFWVHLLQIAGFATVLLVLVISFGGAVGA